jgi:diacylglycerol kinase (ATP)
VVRGGPADVRAVGDPLIEGRRFFVVFNPASGRGRGSRRIPVYRHLLEEALPGVAFATTSFPGEERDLAERAVNDGYDVVVAVGGDGTWSNVADRIVASGRPDVAFGMLPNGTGNDFGRSLGFQPAAAADAVRVLKEGHVRRVDVGRLDTPSAAESRPDVVEPRYFLNLVGFGFDIAVIDAAARARFLKGELLYKLTALQQLFRFPGVELGVRAGEVSSCNGRHLMLTVSNGRFFGGGFPIAPGATVSDGMLHACSILDAPPLTRLKLFNLAGKGRHLSSERVQLMSESVFHLTFGAPPRFEMDGDVRQAAAPELDVRILPGALNVVAPRA